MFELKHVIYQRLFSSEDEKQNNVSRFNGTTNRVDGYNHHAIFGLEIAIVQK